MSKGMNVSKVDKGEIIFREGTLENWMFMVHWGSVLIYANYGSESQKLLGEVKSGEFIGEMGLVEGAVRSATAVAGDECRLIRIDEENFLNFSKENPDKILAIMQHTSHRLRELTQDYLKVSKVIDKYMEVTEAGEPVPAELKAAMKKIAAHK